MKQGQLGPAAVLYSGDMEPITIIPINQFLREMLQERGCVRLPVMLPVHGFEYDAPPLRYEKLRTVEIYTERIVRRGEMHLLLFTHDDENALLLRSAFLPGQQQGLNEERKVAFAKGFLHAVKCFGMQG